VDKNDNHQTYHHHYYYYYYHKKKKKKKEKKRGGITCTRNERQNLYLHPSFSTKPSDFIFSMPSALSVLQRETSR